MNAPAFLAAAANAIATMEPEPLGFTEPDWAESMLATIRRHERAAAKYGEDALEASRNGNERAERLALARRVQELALALRLHGEILERLAERYATAEEIEGAASRADESAYDAAHACRMYAAC